MKHITIKDIRDLNPCYDPIKYLPPYWSGSISDILDLSECPIRNRFWVVFKLLPKDLVIDFVCDVVESALFLYSDNPDQRSIDGIYAARERHTITREELNLARAAANDAADIACAAAAVNVAAALAVATANIPVAYSAYATVADTHTEEHDWQIEHLKDKISKQSMEGLTDYKLGCVSCESKRTTKRWE